MRYSEIVRDSLINCIDKEAENKENYRNPAIDFSRNRKLSCSETIHIVLEMGGNTVNNEMIEHFDYKFNRPTASAFVQSRDKVLPSAFINIFHDFNNSLELYKDFHGNRMFGIDGSNINISRNPDDLETYVKSKNNVGHNSLHLSAAYDLLNKTYVDAVIQPVKTKDERGALIEMLPRFPKKSILVADRGYESYNVFAHIEENNLLYLIRVKDINSNGIFSGLNLPDKEFDEIITVNISNKQGKHLKNIHNYRFSPSCSRFDFSDNKSPVYQLTFRATRIMLENGSYEAIISNLPNEFTPNDI